MSANKPIKNLVKRFERPTEYEFYILVMNALGQLPERIKEDIVGLAVTLCYNVIRYGGSKTPMAEAISDDHCLRIYPHLVIYDAGFREISVQDSLISIIEHEVAHLYGLNHEQVYGKRKENIPVFRYVRCRFNKKGGAKK